MAGFIPELTTRVTVEVDTSGLDDALNLISSDDILSEIPSLTELFEDSKNKLLDSKTPIGEAVSKALVSNQENIISSKHYITGMMAGSVDIMGDGEDFLVGNTAMSVDGFPYPLAIEKGTRSHYISPNTFNALHWKEGSKDYYSKGHIVSGIKADPFVQPSIDDTLYQIDTIVNDVLKDL